MADRKDLERQRSPAPGQQRIGTLTGSRSPVKLRAESRQHVGPAAAHVAATAHCLRAAAAAPAQRFFATAAGCLERIQKFKITQLKNNIA